MVFLQAWILLYEGINKGPIFQLGLPDFCLDLNSSIEISCKIQSTALIFSKVLYCRRALGLCLVSKAASLNSDSRVNTASSFSFF